MSGCDGVVLAECHTTGESRTICSRCKLETQQMTRESSRLFFYSAPGGECDNMIVVLKLVTNLIIGNNFGVEVKGSAESSMGKLAKKKCWQASSRWTTWELSGHCGWAGALQRGARDSLSEIRQGTHRGVRNWRRGGSDSTPWRKRNTNTDKILKEEWRPPLMDETGKQLEKKKMDRNARRLWRCVQKDRSKESWANNCWSGQGGVAKDGEATFSPAKKCPEGAFNRRWALRKSVFGSLERGHTPSIAYLWRATHHSGTVEGFVYLLIFPSFLVDFHQECMFPSSGVIRASWSRLVIFNGLHVQRKNTF